MEKTIIGNLEGIETKKSQAGNTFYKVRIDNKIFSTFDDPTEFLNKTVDITYNEVPNPQNENAPFKNIVKGGIKIAVEQNQTRLDETKDPVFGFDIHKYRAMAISYAKDLIIADKIKLGEMEKTAQLMVDFIESGDNR
jgi:hypothetical protein